MAHADSFIINTSIAAIHRLTASILDVSNAFYNTNVPIQERFCVIPPPYYLDWFEIYYPNDPLNRDDGPFFFNAWMKIKEQTQLDNNLLVSLM